jgi:hypothetical protein
MKTAIRSIIAKLPSRNSGASQRDIDQLAKTMSVELPHEYVTYLLVSNGAAGSLRRDKWVVLWNVAQVIKLNKISGIAEDFGPWLLAFGTDGGDTGYAFDTRKTPFAVVAFSFSSLDPPRMLAPTFGVFLRKLARKQ